MKLEWKLDETFFVVLLPEADDFEPPETLSLPGGVELVASPGGIEDFVGYGYIDAEGNNWLLSIYSIEAGILLTVEKDSQYEL